jgi:hypothetical protein
MPRPGPGQTLDDDGVTWTLDPTTRRLPADPNQAMTAYAPPPEALIALSAQPPVSLDAPSTPHATRALPALPPDAPEWMRAARVLADSLEAAIVRGSVDTLEHAAIERAWYAWTLGGATPKYVHRVAHLVRRAHDAIRASSRGPLESALRDCAEVLYGSLPSPVKLTLPFERVVWVIRLIREEADPWVAVVEGTAELLGWKDYARVHAANVIRSVIDQG